MGVILNRHAVKVKDDLGVYHDIGAIGSGGGGGGEDGGYYTPSVDNSGNLTWTASKTGMPAVQGANIKGPAGNDGNDGAPGPNQVSTTTGTNINGLLKGNGSTVGAAVAGTDYQAPLVAGTDYATPGAIPSAGSANPQMDGTASAGTGTAYARVDHVHPSDTSKQDKVMASGVLKGDGAGGVSAATAGTDYALPSAIPSASSDTPIVDGTATPGSSSAYSRGDHVHPTDTSRQAKITANGILKGDGAGGITAATSGTDYALPSAIPSASSSTPAMDGVGSAGSATAYARADHVHPTDTSRAAAADIGAASGIASLDANGRLTAAQAIARIVTVTGAATLGASHVGAHVFVSSASASTITIPADSNNATFPIGTQIIIWQVSAGAVTVKAATGVIFKLPNGTDSSGASVVIARQNNNVALLKQDATHWLVSGAVS